ncbi:hypothetical protein PC128_g2417 [Phytophthora cactorum]|nr:hypothetical protein PC128_g2417 [Phytophthora cactorum]
MSGSTTRSDYNAKTNKAESPDSTTDSSTARTATSQIITKFDGTD